MTRLLRADWVRFGHRRDLRVLVGLLPVVLAIMFLAEYQGLTTPPQVSIMFNPPDPVAEAQIRAEMLAEWRMRVDAALPSFAFPASLLKVAGNLGPLIVLATYLAAALVAAEFEWGTVRTVHLTARRTRTLAVRAVVILGLVVLGVAAALVFASLIPFVLSFEGRPLQGWAAPVPDLWTGLAIRLAVIGPFVAIPVLMAVLARGIGLALLLTLMVFMLDLAVTAAPFWSGDLELVRRVTVTGSIARLLAQPGSMLDVGPAWVSACALLAWAVAPIGLAIARFRRIDINE